MLPTVLKQLIISYNTTNKVFIDIVNYAFRDLHRFVSLEENGRHYFGQEYQQRVNNYGINMVDQLYQHFNSFIEFNYNNNKIVCNIKDILISYNYIITLIKFLIKNNILHAAEKSSYANVLITDDVAFVNTILDPIPIKIIKYVRPIRKTEFISYYKIAVVSKLINV